MQVSLSRVCTDALERFVKSGAAQTDGGTDIKTTYENDKRHENNENNERGR